MRSIQTVINFSLLIAVLCLGFSGIAMSRRVFTALLMHGPMATARTMHLAVSYWGFVLMSIHLGLHWGWSWESISCPKLSEKQWKTYIEEVRNAHPGCGHLVDFKKCGVKQKSFELDRRSYSIA